MTLPPVPAARARELVDRFRETPILVLGVRRSGTTLLRVMLDRHSELAIPDESYFIPQIADRHSGPLDVESFVDDLGRLKTLREWDVPVEEVRGRLRQGMPVGEIQVTGRGRGVDGSQADLAGEVAVNLG